jgi:hypothetical protein
MYPSVDKTELSFNPLNPKLNPIYHLLALLGANPIFHVSRISVKQQRGFLDFHFREVCSCHKCTNLKHQFLYYLHKHLLQSSTCFEQSCSSSGGSASGVVTRVAVRCIGWERTLPTYAPYGHLRRVTTPDVVLIQFKLLMMSKIARNV